MSDRTTSEHRGDLELAKAVLAGDAAAFHKLFDLYGPPVMGFAQRVRAGSGPARVLAAEILEAVFVHLDGYSGRTPLAAWVLAVARLVARGQAARAAEPRAARSA